MTPQERAKDIFNSFKERLHPLGILYVKVAACACVDEIIKANPAEVLNDDFNRNPQNGNKFIVMSKVPYWREVKEELKKILNPAG